MQKTYILLNLNSRHTTGFYCNSLCELCKGRFTLIAYVCYLRICHGFHPFAMLKDTPRVNLPYSTSVVIMG